MTRKPTVLAHIAGGLFEILWRPADGPVYDAATFGDAYKGSDVGQWLEARSDVYAVLTEPSGRYAYLLVEDERTVRLLFLKLGL